MRAAPSRAAAAYRGVSQDVSWPRAVMLRGADLVLLVPALLLGLVLGSLAAARLVGAGPAQWLVDQSRGEVVRVDARGHADAWVSVGQAGDQIDMVQDGTYLVVVNRRTGAVTSVELASLIASGVRQAASADSIRVLVHAGAWYVADRLGGSVSRIDPATLESTGRVWVSPGGVVDARIDDNGIVWSLTSGGVVTSLRWADGAEQALGRFEATTVATVPGVGVGSRLVAHERGVTVVSGATGAIEQVGTGRPFRLGFQPTDAALLLPERSPSDLVPLSDRAAGVVVIASASGVVRVPTRDLQCPAPGAPVVFDRVLLLPCLGRVLRLGAEGQRVAADIVTGEQAMPAVTLAADRVYVTVPGSLSGVQVLSGGRTRDLGGSGRGDPQRLTDAAAGAADGSRVAPTEPKAGARPSGAPAGNSGG